MKPLTKRILVIILIFYLIGCNVINPKREKHPLDNSFIFLLYENNIFKNYCPSIDATLDSGTYTINLEEGQEYWFKLTQEHYYKSFDIGISKPSSDQKFTFFNGNCIHNRTITNQRNTFTADSEKTVQKDDGEFQYYAFYFYESSSNYLYLGAIKMASGSGEIKIKIP